MVGDYIYKGELIYLFIENNIYFLMFNVILLNLLLLSIVYSLSHIDGVMLYRSSSYRH